MANASVSDVLREAAEYLCKLGNNLKIRSESLKDKRLAKDKLKNSIAVSKAADKMLVICQLSRQSLDNVESSVKKILQVCSSDSDRPKDASHLNQDQSRHKSKISEKDGDEYEKFQYHYIKSKKLKVPINVPLKHYLSCKVKVDSISLKKMLKYPVYYHCKLMKIKQKLRDKENKKSASDHASVGQKHVSENEDNNRIASDNDESMPLCHSNQDIDQRITNDVKCKESKTTQSHSNDCSIIENRKEIVSEENDLNPASSESTDPGIGEKSIDHVKKRKDINVCEDERSTNGKEIVSEDNDLKQSNDLNSSRSQNTDSGIREKSIDHVTKVKDINVFESERTTKGKGIFPEETDLNPASSQITHSGEKSIDPVKKTKDTNVCEDERSTEKLNKDFEKEELDGKECISDCDHTKSNISVVNISDSAEEKAEKECENLNTIKPILKCVNINKLLDSKLLEKKENTISDLPKAKLPKLKPSWKVHFKPNKDKDKSVTKIKLKRVSFKTDEDEYWKKKRDEVKAFKPKEFLVKIIKEPYNKDFLLKYGILKITNGDKIIYKLEGDKLVNYECQNGTVELSNSKQKIRSSVDIKSDDIGSSYKSQPQTVSGNSPPPSSKSNHTESSSDSAINSNNKSTNLSESNSKTRKSMWDPDDSSPDSPSKSVSQNADSPTNSDAESSIVFNPKKRSKLSKQNKTMWDSDNSSPDSPKNKCQSVSPKDSETELKDKDGHSKKNSLNSDSSDKVAEKTLEKSKLEQVKEKLLMDSDSEDFPNKDSNSHDKDSSKHKKKLSNTNESREIEKEKVKNALLHDSDSDNSTSKNTNKQISEITPIEKVDKEKIKNSLLNDSESEEDTTTKNNSPLPENQADQQDPKSGHLKNKRKFSDPGPSPDSKRKCIDAKQMLLTHVSSSDNEDKSNKKNKSSSESEIGSPSKQNRSSDDESLVDNIGRKKKYRKKVKKSKKHQKPVIDSDSSQTGGNLDSDPKRENRKMGRSKASGSSDPESQDTQDKDIDGLTNLKTLMQRKSRHNSTSTDTDHTYNIPKLRIRRSAIIPQEEILKAESESSTEELLEDVNDEAEELPMVSITELNGSGPIDNLAKDDLLDTDSLSSDKDTKEESSSDNPKQKRRKGVISSDSEFAIKDKDGSDFEESDSSVPKKTKRKKKLSDSNGSGNESGAENAKKKRRRIKVDDSDDSGSESETEGKKHGRKNIRKVMGKDQLEEATKKAAREEKERIARIAERQKMYNNLAFDESGKPDEVVLEKVVLDFDPETKEPLIQVDRGLVKKLKPHQANGIKFMWDACFESVKRIKKDKGSGCILAHCMGLGKTLQVVTLTHTLLAHSKLTGVHRVLVVCPLSTVLNWVNEYKMWLKHAQNDSDIDIYELSRHKQNSERAYQLQEWLTQGGICVLGYEMFRNLSADNPKKFRKKMLKTFQESLVNPGPDLVVCDEGHLLKNEKTSLSQSMNRVRTLRRIVLTGTPLQNNLKEYYCMVQFVKPNLLGKYNEYLNRFVNPITNGQYTDSTEQDIRVMKRRSHVLHKMLDGSVQRRDYGVLAPFLPPKHEYVLFICLTEVQIKLYQYYLDNYSRRPLAGKSSGFLFPDFQSLQRIWTHPLVLKYNSERYEIQQQKKREREEEDSEGSLVDFINDDSTSDESTTEDSSDSMSDLSDDSRKKSKKKSKEKKVKKEKDAKTTRRGTRANPGEPEEERTLSDVEEKSENPTEWWVPLVLDGELDDLRNSNKLLLLFHILRQCEAIGDKLLVFSQSLYSLDLIEHFLSLIDEATQEGKIDEKLGGNVGSWSPGIDYFRLDGSTSCENRSIWCKNFNREDNPRARLFLISTRAGGLGINLVAANRVVIFDVSWNPSHDVQSIFRVYRFGQKKPCYVYRFLAMGTMEEKIYERQVTKQAISKRVIDEQQIDRHYAENDLAELYKFEPKPPEPRPLPPLPKDRLFAEMLREHDKEIYKYHEHDSLLENKEEETLTEEERKAAWEDFENEKTRPPPTTFPNWPMQGILQQQQQQQYAFNAIASMLRKEYPNLSEQQLASMLPLIYSANPALMQKMNDMYKYANPGMMNPAAAMMNPAMAGNLPGPLGGSSSLQYEPPWQRQQQQMRLQQQLMQQQRNMNAKYYAGGLGSRDPVAMALQQQQARQLLAPNDGRRPRGRPPLARTLPAQTTTATATTATTVAPATHDPADVVDLDSD